jgi:hypothetical protein
MPAIDLAFAGEGFEALCQGFGAKRSVCDGKGDRDFSGQMCMWGCRKRMSLIVEARNQKTLKTCPCTDFACRALFG